MDWNTTLESTLAMSQQWQERAIKDLTPTQLKWSPGPEANHIGWTYLHAIQVEDAMVSMASGRKQVSETGGWATKMGLAPGTRVGGMKPQEAVAFNPPPLATLNEYSKAVRQETLQWIKGLKQEDLERKWQTERGEFSVVRCISLMVSESFQHVGQMGYIRGLIDQRKIA